LPQVYVHDVELSSVPAGGSARVVDVDLDDGPRVRLRELGLRPGGDVRVTHRGAFGGLVVAVGADRFAVDARTASCIRVVPGPVAGVVPGPVAGVVPGPVAGVVPGPFAGTGAVVGTASRPDAGQSAGATA